MVAKRTPDLPWAGTFFNQCYMVETVLWAYFISADGETPHYHREADIEGALRVIGTADELCLAPQMTDTDILPADRAWTERHLFGSLVHDLIPDLLPVRLQLVEDTVEHLA